MNLAAISKQSSSNQSSQSTVSSKYTSVTSYDPTILKQQKGQIQNQISQLQKSGGSSSQIQKLNQALSTVEERLQKPSSTNEQAEDTETAAPTSSSKFFNQVDTKA